MGQLRSSIGGHVGRAVKFTGDELKQIIPILKGAFKTSMQPNAAGKLVPVVNDSKVKTVGDLIWHYPGKGRKIITGITGVGTAGTITVKAAEKIFGDTPEEKIIKAAEIHRKADEDILKSGKYIPNPNIPPAIVPPEKPKEKTITDILNNDPRFLGVAAAGGLGYLAYQKLKSLRKKKD